MNNDFLFDHVPSMEGFIQMAHEHSLPDESIHNAFKRACDFLNLPEVEVVEALKTGEISNNPFSFYDDEVQFNREELKSLNVNNEDSLTQVFIHEVMHRYLQAMHPMLDSWVEESACDFMIGVYSGLAHVDATGVIEGLASTHGWYTHPTGELREDNVHAGLEFAQRMEERGIVPTIDQCMQEFNLYMHQKAPEFYQAKQEIYKEFPMAAVAQEVNGVNSAEWNMKQAQSNKEWAEWHEKEAEAAAKRGDTSSAKDHYSRAASYREKANDYIKAAQSSSKP